jgi:integrase
MLMLDFRYRGKRCREQTLLSDTPANRTRLLAMARRIDRAIAEGTFNYADFFPHSRHIGALALPASPVSQSVAAKANTTNQSPLFSEFAETWFAESEPRWRKRYRRCMRDTLDRIFTPHFGAKCMGEITKADLLAFRAEIAKRRGRGGRTLSARRINKLMSQLKSIINEGCDRSRVSSPWKDIAPLKQKRFDVRPFSLAEVERLIATVREDYRPYLTVRCMTGLRTGEADGLQWCDIDFDKNVIKVERSHSRNGDGELKTESSRREVPMVPPVRSALIEQKSRAIDGCPWVFHTIHGHPIDGVNFTNRVWYPLLRHLGLAVRPPYQMRHTAATLMLASGENPEWVAMVLGHTTTEMLFRVYSRFVPNLTRQDGRAFAGLINSHSAEPKAKPALDVDAMDADALRRELKSLLSRQSPQEVRTH